MLNLFTTELAFCVTPPWHHLFDPLPPSVLALQAFAEHIRYCANKVGLGVNFMPNTPSYDRVVEMQAVNEALQRAFPDMRSDDYPWPDHERRGEEGTGWTAAPEAKTLVLPDPTAETTRIALGKGGAVPRSRPGTARPASRGGGAGSPPLPSGAGSPQRWASSPSPTQSLTRHQAASSPSLLQAETSLQQQLQRPSSALPTGGSPRQMERPSSASRTRFSNLASSDATAGSRYEKLHRTLSAGPQYAAEAAVESSSTRGSPRPQTAAPLSVSPRGRPQSAAPRQQQQQRPVSAGRHLPARLSAKLGGMQGTLAAVRAASGGGSGSIVQAGSTRELPRLRYTAIDVQALE